jgi:membrane peptidoglycan carboxypeptidase
VLLALAALAAAAWVSSPSATGLAGHIAARLHGTAGKSAAAATLPPILRDAVVATEDERFYRHHGIDLIGVIRALPYDLSHLSFAQGASTITEQVAKVLYLGGNDHNPWRKLEDAAVALKLERRYSKAEILAAYLNSAYFGDGAYGIRAASERYFGIPPRRLRPAQATLLAGLIQAPSAYDPLTHPAAARARQVEVLRSLVRNGFLTQAGARSLLVRPLRLRDGAALPAPQTVDLSPGPAFVWWELALGAAIACLGIAASLATRLPLLRVLPGMIAIRLVLVLVIVVGAGAIVRSFRTA